MPEMPKLYDLNQEAGVDFVDIDDVEDEDDEMTEPIIREKKDFVGSVIFNRGISPRHQESVARGMSGEVFRDFHQEKINEAMAEAEESIILREGIQKRAISSRIEARSLSEQKMTIERDIRLARERMSSLSILPWKDREEKNELKSKLLLLEAQKNKLMLDHVARSDYEERVRERLHELEVEMVKTSRFNILKRRELNKKILEQRALANNLAVWSAVSGTDIRK